MAHGPGPCHTYSRPPDPEVDGEMETSICITVDADFQIVHELGKGVHISFHVVFIVRIDLDTYVHFYLDAAFFIRINLETVVLIKT